MWNDETACNVERIEYLFRMALGRLYMPPGNCCHMDGCIAMFERIDQNVTMIITYVGVMPDTAYTRTDAGWKSRKMRLVPA